MSDPKYSKSIEQLEEIIRKIEHEEIDVDELAASVKKASALIKVCRDKIEKAEMEVKQAVEEFQSSKEE